MGKSKKIKVTKAPRHQPLDHQMLQVMTNYATSKECKMQIANCRIFVPFSHFASFQDETVEPSGRVKQNRPRQSDDADFVDGKLSKQILNQAKKQLQEIEDETEEARPKKKAVAIDLGETKRGEDSDKDEDEDSDDGGEGCTDMDDVAQDIRIHSKDEEAFSTFMSGGTAGGATKTLADIIREKRTEIETQYTDAGSLQRKELDPDLVELCEGVGQVLKRYRSGKVPKFFKMIPQYRNWEELLCITQPDEWSAAAVFRATKIFTSALKTNMAQRYFNQYLLPRVRDDIKFYGRLNFHLFQAMRKALFKPGAFFKVTN
jgi:essential nuclear protein 1